MPAFKEKGDSLRGKGVSLLLVLSKEELPLLSDLALPTPLWDFVTRPLSREEVGVRVRNLLRLGGVVREMGLKDHILKNSPTVLFYLEATSEGFLPRWVSPNMEKVLGIKASEFDNRWWREKVHPEDLEKLIRKEQLLKTRDFLILSYRLRREGGDYLWIEERLRILKDHEGEVLGVVGSWTDVTQQKQLEARLKEAQRELLRLATHDPLTGLPNRRLFYDRLELALARARRLGHKVALVFLDVDALKPINDRYGHQEGDRVLVELAKRLKGTVREMDTVARLGGDEFGIILTDIPRECPLVSFWERLKEALERPFRMGGGEVEIGVSFGEAFYPEDGDTSEELLRVADTRMYQRKRSRAQPLPR